MTQTPNDPDSVSLNLSCNLGAFPASSMKSPDKTNGHPNSAYRPDLISRGVISLASAESCFAHYKEHLDPYIQYMLTDNDSLASLRSRSSLLTAAICTVAALCTGTNEYQRCLDAFKAETSRKLFADSYEFDDVRALCIGSLWLTDVSSALNGLGRFATGTFRYVNRRLIADGGSCTHRHTIGSSQMHY